MQAFILRNFILAAGLIFGRLEPGAQGIVLFANRVGSAGIDAPVTLPDGRRVTSEDGYLAQLFAGRPGTPLSSLEPTFPMRLFRVSTPGYMEPVEITVPGIGFEEQALVVIRAFNGKTWEESSCRGESNPVLVTLGINTQPPDPLFGLQGFQIICIPEPRAWLMVVLGAGVFGMFRRWKGKV